MLGFAGGLLILSGCFVYGMTYSIRLKKRIEILRDMINVFDRMKGFMGYSMLEMEDIFIKLDTYEYSVAVDGFIKCILIELNKSDIETFEQIWTSAVKKCFTGLLKSSEISVITQTGHISDYLDKENQIKLIESAGYELKEILSTVKEGAPDKMKAYIITGLSVGLILVITLI